MVRASRISTSSAHVLVQSWGQTEGARRRGAFMSGRTTDTDRGGDTLSQYGLRGSERRGAGQLTAPSPARAPESSVAEAVNRPHFSSREREGERERTDAQDTGRG